MAEHLITSEAAAEYVREHCPQRLSITTYGDREPVYLCGCRQCPELDPTPEQFRRRVEEAIWQASQTLTLEVRCG